eukprot:Gb_01277 [translate_table: standard]
MSFSTFTTSSIWWQWHCAGFCTPLKMECDWGVDNDSPSLDLVSENPQHYKQVYDVYTVRIYLRFVRAQLGALDQCLISSTWTSTDSQACEGLTKSRGEIHHALAGKVVVRRGKHATLRGKGIAQQKKGVAQWGKPTTNLIFDVPLPLCIETEEISSPIHSDKTYD